MKLSKAFVLFAFYALLLSFVFQAVAFVALAKMDMGGNAERIIMIAGYVFCVTFALVAAKKDFHSESGGRALSGKRVAVGVLAAIVLVGGLVSLVARLDRSAEAPADMAGTDGPAIFSIAPDNAPRGAVVTVTGKNLSGFEGDLELIFERADGKKISLFDDESYAKTGGDRIVVTLKEPCQAGETVHGRYSGSPFQCDFVAFTPGVYKVYSAPWGSTTNAVTFTVTN